MKPIIEVKKIGKKYNINHERGGYVALRDVLTNIFKNPFSFLKYKTKEVLGIDTKEEFWALKDVNFTIEKGEVVGIIGRNGAGKSTLLKILSQITPPTEGEIRINGTVGSILEVGTGFHPELTGRENIFLNGAILGMKKKDIINKFDDIVKFAEIDKFLDTPVKYYSSGMYVRLAFSVAAHMDTDILIIDEVLAVGDADFQRKCLGKMEEITKGEGRTIIFVSHNIDAIRDLCRKIVWLDKGSIKMLGETEKVIYTYAQQYVGGISTRWEKSSSKQGVNAFFEPQVFELIENGSDLYIHIDALVEKLNPSLTIGYALYGENRELLYWSYQTDGDENILSIGLNKIKTKLPIDILNSGKYTIELIGGLHNKEWFYEPNRNNPTLYIEVKRTFNSPLWTDRRPGLLAPKIIWEKV